MYIQKIFSDGLFVVVKAAITSLIILSSIAFATDHVDGDIYFENPLVDISDLYAFMSPQNPERLVLILNSYPFVPPRAHFSDKLTYRFRIKPVEITGMGLESRFNIVDKEYRFDCRFLTPHDLKEYSITCRSSLDESIKRNVNDESGKEKDGIRVFAGKREDPFLFDSSWFKTLLFDRCIPPSNASNEMSNLNVLSIVLEFDISKLTHLHKGSLFAVAGEITQTLEGDKHETIMDRVGRPEVSNGRLVTLVNEEDLRPYYNREDTFSLKPENKTRYQARLQENLDYLDGLDEMKDWSKDWGKVLVDLLVNDFLVIDIAKPFSSSGYFDIESSMLDNKPHTRSGGRVPGERVINQLTTTMINGGHGQGINDGIAPNNFKNKVFPYLDKPASGIWPYVKNKLAKRIVKGIAMKKRDLTIKPCEN
ncbi:DUF4331 family protein [Agarilytica rhodophyticola]|uniref:DUF4331 family protein n=1 Tax=Agarilytica rhodophyticola TaxID=1737490 RepID=UPI000B341B6C|nr:DUF4331 family protein [Agarilytica rhodophyticola]